MTPEQSSMCYSVKHHMRQFYANPENERAFQEWKKEREACKPNRAPSNYRRKKQRINHTPCETSCARSSR